MKKPSSLAQQVQQAQRIYEGWSDSRKASLRLEGTDVFLNRHSSNQSLPQKTETKKTKN